MNDLQKAKALADAMVKLANEYQEEGRPEMADRVSQARILVMASPDSAARLFDIFKAL